MLMFVEKATKDVQDLQQDKPNVDQIRESVVSQVQSDLNSGLQAVRESMQKEVSVLKEQTTASAPQQQRDESVDKTVQVIYAK